jgi:hypothetical protein
MAVSFRKGNVYVVFTMLGHSGRGIRAGNGFVGAAREGASARKD